MKAGTASIVLVLLLGAGFEPACSSFGGTSPEDSPDGGGLGDGAVLDEAGHVVTGIPQGCDASAEPKDAPLCVDDGFGIFVDAKGADTNPGTKRLPVKSVAGALGKLAGRHRIYICEGMYTEHVALTSDVSLFGGFECAGWRYSAVQPQFAPQDAGYALELSNSKGIVVSDLSFAAQPGTASARSSVAAFAHGATAQLLRVSLIAGAGMDGAGGAPQSNYDVTLLPSDVKLAGHPGKSGVGPGAAQQECSGLCANGEHSTGGNGGDYSAVGGLSTGGANGLPDRGAGKGDAVSNCNPGPVFGQKNGNPGKTGDDAPPPSQVGTLTEAGWAPSDGPAATAGGPGQGGGGGSNVDDPYYSGGASGGCGGCGGAPGTAAQGGGASIALLSYSSTLNLSVVVLSTSRAGNGASNVPGQVGQVGGNGGGVSCPGGRGGDGGAAGASAGAAGGVSVGILWNGTSPTLAKVTTTTGSAGLPGTGGKAGANDGPPGQKADILEVH